MKKFSFFLLLFLSLFPLFTSTLSAASIGVDDITGSMNIIFNPRAPRPNELVEISVEASGASVNESVVTWRINGETVKSGRGERKITYTTGKVGEKAIVAVTVDGPRGKFDATKTINPAEVDLIPQGAGYTHPFYLGRRIWARQNSLIVLAVPNIIGSNGAPVNPNNLVYRWKVNNLIAGQASGVGKNTFEYTDTVLSNPKFISIEILSGGNQILAEGYINLDPTMQEVLVYEDNPLYGFLFNKEVGTKYYMTSEETTLGAFPFFYSTPSRLAGNVEYEWRTNNKAGDKGASVTYRAPEGVSGTSYVSLHAYNTNQVIQDMRKNFNVEFNQDR